jgi:hypothetical protein
MYALAGQDRPSGRPWRSSKTGNRKAKLALCRELIHTPVIALLPLPQNCRQLRQALDTVTSFNPHNPALIRL